jgi:replicative DNA helicase
MEELRFEIRDNTTKEKLFAIDAIEVDADAFMLLEYLKNEYAQTEIIDSLSEYVENSMSFEDAQESVDHLHQIVLDVEDKVELEKPTDSMQRIKLFEDEDSLGRYVALGLNSEYDQQIQFSPRDLVLIGGKRGAGKSLTCANIANNAYSQGKSAIYFTIEMDSRAILQRCCAVATGIPYGRLKLKNLNLMEWERVANWWANRFVDGQERIREYKENRDFERFHHSLTTSCELHPQHQLDVVYDASLTLSKIRAELDKKSKTLDLGVIIVDYINQVKRSSMPHRNGQYDWTEQIEVSKALKSMAQEYEVPVISPYQIDATGEARFAKGILDAADAAYTLDAHDKEDNCMTFNCVKMRDNEELSFTSEVDWASLKIGPDSALPPSQREDEEEGAEGIHDI